jgi:hypothetical protein
LGTLQQLLVRLESYEEEKTKVRRALRKGIWQCYANAISDFGQRIAEVSITFHSNEEHDFVTFKVTADTNVAWMAAIAYSEVTLSTNYLLEVECKAIAHRLVHGVLDKIVKELE